MIRYSVLVQHVSFPSLLLKLTIGVLVAGLFATSGFADSPDFYVNAESITFSNPHPIEGEEITIWVEVQNIGEGTPTMNEDLVVDLYEGDPATQPLQILCSDVILELKAGRTDRVAARWQPPPGQTEIYAVVNPTGEEHIAETNVENNITHATIVAEKYTFPAVTPDQIQETTQERDYLDKNTTRQT